MRLHLPLLLGLSAVAAAQWTKVDVPTTASLRGLSVIHQNVVWASGTGGTVIKTTDRGKSWSVIAVPGAEKLDFRGIHAFDEKNALIMSSGPAEQGQAQIYRTTDGGKSWKQVFEDKRPGIFFDAIAFWDRRHGIVLSDPIDGHFALFRTDDGGASWKQIPPAALPPSLPSEGAFAASNSCLTVQGEQNVWFATGGAKVARVFRSSNRAKTWSVAETPMHPANASSGIFSVTFREENFGVAVGGDYAHPESSDLPNVLQTHDGGTTWQAGTPTNPPGIYLSSVASDRQETVSAGIKGIWWSSNIWINEFNDSVNAIAFGGEVIWAVGPKGTVLK